MILIKYVLAFQPCGISVHRSVQCVKKVGPGQYLEDSFCFLSIWVCKVIAIVLGYQGNGGARDFHCLFMYVVNVQIFVLSMYYFLIAILFF